MILADVGTYALTTLIGLVAGFIGALLKEMLSGRSRTDQELRRLRTPFYEKLWKLTERLPNWQRPELKNADLLEFSQQLTTWYFESGIYLSRPSHNAYVAVQDAVAGGLNQDAPHEAVDEKVYESIRDKCSALRTELTDDLLSRRSGSRVLA